MANQEKIQRKFNRRLEKAFERHSKLIEQDRFSLASDVGKTAIIVSGQGDSKSHYSHTEQVSAFNNEADELAGRIPRTEIMRRATPFIMADVLGDPEVSNIVLIGHGSIGCFWLEQGEKYGWADVASATRHLKLGSFVQRTCGRFSCVPTVPLGTFAVRDFSQVYAPLGEAIDDLYPEEDEFVQVYSSRSDVCTQVYQLNQLYAHQAE